MKEKYSQGPISALQITGKRVDVVGEKRFSGGKKCFFHELALRMKRLQL
jgi:hypothetical protein